MRFRLRPSSARAREIEESDFWHLVAVLQGRFIDRRIDGFLYIGSLSILAAGYWVSSLPLALAWYLASFLAVQTFRLIEWKNLRTSASWVDLAATPVLRKRLAIKVLSRSSRRRVLAVAFLPTLYHVVFVTADLCLASLVGGLAFMLFLLEDEMGVESLIDESRSNASWVIRSLWTNMDFGFCVALLLLVLAGLSEEVALLIALVGLSAVAIAALNRSSGQKS